MPIMQQGVGQQTPAAQNVWRSVGGAVRRAVRGTRRKRKAKRARLGPVRLSKSNTRRVKGRLKKGSAAAKAYMASIRRKRKK